MRVAFTLIGGKSWTGGYNYLRNLVNVLARHSDGQVLPVLFFGTDVDESDAAPFAGVAGAEVVHSELFNQTRRKWSLATALSGCDVAVRRLLHERKIDLLFESAQFFGWRLGLPTIAWIPDFQHRYLRHLFTQSGYWKRELGFRAQVLGGRTIMVSSEDSRLACERFYPTTVGRTYAVRFAVPSIEPVNEELARGVADRHGLPTHYFFLPNQFWKHKNHILVLEALALLRSRGREIVVAASGRQLDPRDPEHFPRLKRTIESMGLGTHFKLLGLVPYEDLVSLMSASTALLNPSLFEGWSTTVEEARSLGVPMLLSDLDVHREQAGYAATYFDRNSASSLADALANFPPRDPDVRARLASEARAESIVRARRFACDFITLAERCTHRERQP